MRALILLLFLFLLTQLFGLLAGETLISKIEEGEMEPPIQNPQNLSNSLVFFFYVIVTTIVLVLIIKYKKVLLVGVELVVITFSSLLTLSLFLNFFVSLALVFALLIWKTVRPGLLNKNLLVVLSIAGIGAFLGGSLGTLPVLLFVLILSVYDFVSVYVTKHMVYLAKELTSRATMFTVTIPAKAIRTKLHERKVRLKALQLGSGDLVCPLMFAVSILREFGAKAALFSILGSFVALALLFLYISQKERKPLPALPTLFGGNLLGFILSIIVKL